MSTFFETILANERMDDCVCDEPDTFLELNEEFNFGPVDIQEKIDGIELATESLAKLIDIRSTVSKTSQPEAITIKMANIAVEDIKKQLGIFDDGKLICTESFTENNISQESFGSMLKTIWETIVRTFRAIWEAVMRMFGKKTSQAQRDKVSKAAEKVNETDPKQLKALTVTVTDDISKRDTHSEHTVVPTSGIEPTKVEPVATAPLDNVEKFSSPTGGLGFLGNRLKLRDLIHHLEEIQKNYKKLSTFADRVEVCSVMLAGIAHRMPSELPEGERFDNEMLDKINVFLESYSKIPTTFMIKTESISKYWREIHVKTGLDANQVDKNNCFVLDKFTFGRQFYLFSKSSQNTSSVTEQDTFKWFKFVSEHKESNCSVNLITPEQFDEYCTKIISIMDENDKIVDNVKTSCERAFKFQEEAMNKLSKSFNSFGESVGSKEYVNGMAIINVVKNFVELISHVYSLEKLCDDSMRTHRHLALDIGRGFVE